MDAGPARRVDGSCRGSGGDRRSQPARGRRDLRSGRDGGLVRRGVALAPETARAQYRALSFQTLVVALVSLGLGSLTEREETVRTVLARSVAAVDRLGFGAWLDAL